MARLRSWVSSILALLITLGFFTCMGCIFFVKLEVLNHDLMNVLCGVLGTVWIQVVSGYFPKKKGD